MCIRDRQDAINDCKAGDLTANAESGEGSASVHAWDEAVAFYTGSLELTTKGGLTGYKEDGVTGYLQYYLADKRCENFGTCTASYDTNPDDFTGESKVNEEIITLFQRGEAEITAAVDSTSSTKCDVPAKTMEEVATKMLVPFIQGTIRYLHKTSTLSGRSAKQAGELFAFASTVLPFIHAVDPAAATMLYSHVWEMPADPANDVNTVATIKSAIEATYPKLGFGAGIGTIKCSDIGQLYPYLSGCVDTVSSTIEDYAGYEPITDVTMHSRIDLDLELSRLQLTLVEPVVLAVNCPTALWRPRSWQTAPVAIMTARRFRGRPQPMVLLTFGPMVNTRRRPPACEKSEGSLPGRKTKRAGTVLRRKTWTTRITSLLPS